MSYYFFDLPVYRLTETQYRAEVQRYADKVVFPKGTLHGDLYHEEKARNPVANREKVANILESFGGCWRFNEIVGYIRLHFLGTQVRGEYFAPNRKRIVRSRTRTLEFRAWKLAPEVDIEAPISGTTIVVAVQRYIEDCRRELPRRFVDTQAFDRLCPHIDWLSLFETAA